jgi:CubicO group peptidase (beta-lactamase class C family)
LTAENFWPIFSELHSRPLLRSFDQPWLFAAYGAPGSGGSFGFADPAAQVGYAYVTNKQWAGMLDDPREKALRDAFYRIIM